MDREIACLSATIHDIIYNQAVDVDVQQCIEIKAIKNDTIYNVLDFLTHIKDNAPLELQLPLLEPISKLLSSKYNLKV